MSLKCDHCSLNHHKKCTNLKKAGGHWKPSHWKCSNCVEKDPKKVTVENDDNKIASIQKPSGKHRKSNAIGCEHHNLEFLESQINTLKSIVAKREAELKKVQESDNLKAKKIMNLETQLNEARKLACQTNSIPETQTNHGSFMDSSKIYNLETRTNYLENQIILLSSKLEKIEVNPSKAQPISPPGIITVYPCDLCECDFNSRQELNVHRNEKHSHIHACHTCKLTKTQSISQNLPEQTYSQTIDCNFCTFKARTEIELNIHIKDMHQKCQDCSYHAIHSKDLRRHRNTMHKLPPNCKYCTFTARNDYDMEKHQSVMHSNDIPIPCDKCKFSAKSQGEMNNHRAIEHTYKQRTRIFSARRQSTTSPPPEQNPISSQNEIFRPWSLSQAPLITSSTLSSQSAPPLPKPFTSSKTDIPDGFLSTRNYNQD